MPVVIPTGTPSRISEAMRNRLDIYKFITEMEAQKKQRKSQNLRESMGIATQQLLSGYTGAYELMRQEEKDALVREQFELAKGREASRRALEERKMDLLEERFGQQRDEASKALGFMSYDALQQARSEWEGDDLSFIKDRIGRMSTMRRELQKQQFEQQWQELPEDQKIQWFAALAPEQAEKIATYDSVSNWLSRSEDLVRQHMPGALRKALSLVSEQLGSLELPETATRFTGDQIAGMRDKLQKKRARLLNEGYKYLPTPQSYPQVLNGQIGEWGGYVFTPDGKGGHKNQGEFNPWAMPPLPYDTSSVEKLRKSMEQNAQIQAYRNQLRAKSMELNPYEYITEKGEIKERPMLKLELERAKQRQSLIEKASEIAAERAVERDRDTLQETFNTETYARVFGDILADYEERGLINTEMAEMVKEEFANPPRPTRDRPAPDRAGRGGQAEAQPKEYFSTERDPKMRFGQGEKAKEYQYQLEQGVKAAIQSRNDFTQRQWGRTLRPGEREWMEKFYQYITSDAFGYRFARTDTTSPFARSILPDGIPFWIAEREATYYLHIYGGGHPSTIREKSMNSSPPDGVWQRYLELVEMMKKHEQRKKASSD